jgi:hypothetical protein
MHLFSSTPATPEKHLTIFFPLTLQGINRGTPKKPKSVFQANKHPYPSVFRLPKQSQPVALSATKKRRAYSKISVDFSSCGR